MTPAQVAERLVAEQPSFHADDGEPRVWNAAPDTLRMIARHVQDGWRTLETGSGASSVMFIAAGAQHTGISPHPSEHDRIRAWCESAGIDHSRAEFIAGSSDSVLPALELDRPLDAAFIDGKHSFPHPVLDWHFVERRLRVGGTLMLDDIPIPSVALAFRHMAADPSWQLLEIADDRAAAFRKLAEQPTGDAWDHQPFNRGGPDLSFAPPVRRTAIRARTLARRLLRR